ncbi:MAG: CoA transferase, partial [Dehalococcoidales bacterium]|nr:CoA transferase [Dehalococcoidales bacterium]
MSVKNADFTLKGIKVIETAQVKAGPMAGKILASWGAEVIHVEHPVRGDISRSVRDPNFKKTALPAAAFIESDINYEEENHNRNKRAMTLDFSKEEGRQILHKMLETADILLSNFRPREIEKFKLQYENLSKKNPRLIHANITGYGMKGPDRDAPAFDTIGFYVRSGFSHSLTRPGLPPPNSPLSSGDHMTGLALVTGIMTALFAREKTGIGQVVDASL